MELDYFTLLSCNPDVPYHFSDTIDVYPPTLENIRRLTMPIYQAYINILATNKENVCEALEIGETDIPGDALMFITAVPFLREILLAALSFFIRQEVFYDEDKGYSLKDGSFLSMKEIRRLRKVILRFSYVEEEEDPSALTFKNAKAKKIYEKIQALKAEQAKRNRGKKNPDMELGNLIGSVSAFSSSYNLLNIWNLTVFQFYDQYIRLDSKIHLDICGVRWAAYGEDDFPWDSWHKAVGAKKGDNNT